MLSGKQIQEEMARGRITITPFNERQLGANSYDVRLGNRLLVYQRDYLDLRGDNPTDEIIIPEEGIVLEKGRLYLGETVEETWCDGFVPQFIGRSSIARLGLFTNIAAGFGDNKWRGKWTLEFYPCVSLKAYPGAKIGQVFFTRLENPGVGYDELQNSKYMNASTVQASRSWRDYAEAGNGVDGDAGEGEGVS